MGEVSSIPCCVEHDSIRERFTLEDREGSLRAKVAWGQRYAFIADVLDNRRVWPYDEASELYAATAAIAPVPAQGTEDGQLIQYDEALIDVTYTPRIATTTETGASSESSGDYAYEDEDPEEHEPPITDLMAESFEPSAEFILLDHEFFSWSAADGDPLRPGESPGRLVLGAILVRTLFQVETVPAKALSSIGKVNDGNYTSRLLGVGFAPETLLYLPPTMSRTIKSDGSDAWTLTMRFSYKGDGWNKYWRSSSMAWESIYVKGGGEYRSYPKGNFSGLLF